MSKTLKFIPAVAGTVAVVVIKTRNDDERFVLHLHRSIVGWAVTRHFALPILAGSSLRENETLLLPLPDGKFQDPHGNVTYKSLDIALAEIRSDWVERHDGCCYHD